MKHPKKEGEFFEPYLPNSEGLTIRIVTGKGARPPKKPRPAFIAQLPKSIRYVGAESTTTPDSDGDSEWATVGNFLVDMTSVAIAEIKMIRVYCPKDEYERLLKRK